MIKIPVQFEEKVLQFPESSYGVTRVVITLEDGTMFSDVFIAWGREIVKVGSSQQVPFDASKIVEITHQ